MNKPKYSLLLSIALTASVASAQTPPGAQPPPPDSPAAAPQPGAPGADPMEQNTFPPEFIMQHQKELNLSAKQERAIRTEMQQTMAKFADLQWQESGEAQVFASLVSARKLDEQKVLAQLDKVLNVENEIKRLHTGLLVRLRNILDDGQVAQLKLVRQTASPRRPPGPAPEAIGRVSGKIIINGPVHSNFIPLAPGEHKGILEVILSAGPSEFANLKKVRLTRIDPTSGKEETKMIDVEEIKNHPSKDVPLQEGDHLDVREKNILFQ